MNENPMVMEQNEFILPFVLRLSPFYQDITFGEFRGKHHSNKALSGSELQRGKLNSGLGKGLIPEREDDKANVANCVLETLSFSAWALAHVCQELGTRQAICNYPSGQPDSVSSDVIQEVPTSPMAVQPKMFNWNMLSISI